MTSIPTDPASLNHNISLILVILLSTSCLSKTKQVDIAPSTKLQKQQVTIDLEHRVWDRFSPTWWKLGEETIGHNGYEVIPANESLRIPDGFWVNPCEGRAFRFTGTFFEEPQEYGGKKMDYKALTLRYTAYEYLPRGKEIAPDLLTSFRAYEKLLRLDHRSNAGYHIHLTDCPNDSSEYYLFDVSVKASNGESVRISKNSGEVELKNKRTGEYEPLRE